MESKDRREIVLKSRIFAAVILAMGLILVARLAWIQIIESDVYQSSAASNRTRLLTIKAARGDIVTADGVVMATDQPIFQVNVNSQTLDGLADEERNIVINTLVNILQDSEITAESIEQSLKDNRYRKYKPVTIKTNLDMETVSEIEARRLELPGVTVTTEPKRVYLQDNIAGHVIGYLGEVNQDELEANENYKLGDIIGKIGVEKSYDEYLRGEDGVQQVEVDVYNNAVGEVTTVDASSGNDVFLTIDYDLQKSMEDAFDEVIANLQANPRSDKAGAGAAVLLEVKTGKVLAMVSRPDDKVTQQNRAIQGRYIPGSTFKPVTLTAALENDKVTTTERIYNPGRYWEAPYIKSTAPVGYYNVYSATAKSDNVFFQEIGRRAGIDLIGEAGVELGLEGSTGIDLPYESKGERVTEGLPTRSKINAYNSWAAETKGAYYDRIIEKTTAEYEEDLANATDETEKKSIERKYKNTMAQLKAQKAIDVKWVSEWHASDTYNVAIGQGRQNYTPLQLARYCATIANGGKIMKPYVVDHVQDKDGNIILQNEPETVDYSSVSAETFKIVEKAMTEVSQPGGTAYSVFYDFPPEIKVAAKTGTSQPGQASYKSGNKEYYDGIFIAYAPADDPQIAFAAVVEYGYSGNGSGGRICREVFKTYFGLN